MNPISISIRHNLGYDPFGMLVQERVYTAKEYRFGFQGQEKDDEIKGGGNSLAFMFRIYDARLGRFLSVDPLSPEYPFYTPYQFAANQPIHAVDIEGLESSSDANPTTVAYTVKSGETLGAIAKKFGTSPEAIAKATETWEESKGGYARSGYDKIYVGEVLNVPDNRSSSSPSSTVSAPKLWQFNIGVTAVDNVGLSNSARGLHTIPVSPTEVNPSIVATFNLVENLTALGELAIQKYIPPTQVYFDPSGKLKPINPAGRMPNDVSKINGVRTSNTINGAKVTLSQIGTGVGIVQSAYQMSQGDVADAGVTAVITLASRNTPALGYVLSTYDIVEYAAANDVNCPGCAANFIEMKMHSAYSSNNQAKLAAWYNKLVQDFPSVASSNWEKNIIGIRPKDTLIQGR